MEEWQFASATPEVGWLTRNGSFIRSSRRHMRRDSVFTFHVPSCGVSRATCTTNRRAEARLSSYSCQPLCERAKMMNMSSKIQVLLIDDQSLFRERLSRL